MLHESLPFSSVDELPSNYESTDLPPLTLVNSKPLDELGPFIAPYVPCHEYVIQKALKFSKLCDQDILLDLGCGDARILIAAMEMANHPRKCIGVELDPVLARLIRSRHGQSIQSEKLVLLETDMFSIHISDLDATVMILYLLPGGLDKLKGAFLAWFDADSAAPTKRIITITYSIPGWEPEHAEEVILPNGLNRQWLFFYTCKSIR